MSDGKRSQESDLAEAPSHTAPPSDPAAGSGLSAAAERTSSARAPGAQDAPVETPSGDDWQDEDPDAPLGSYLRAKQAVGFLLRRIERLFERDSAWAAERIHDLLARLGEDRFQLVVLGQFKRGKTSLMNAVIGRALLPTATIPLTSVVTTLRHGSVVRALVRTADRAREWEIPIGALPSYITERGNPRNQRGVLSATVEVPAPFLRRGLHFIDTPGVGSAHEHNTAVTLAFLDQADAAIFVTGADGPLSQAELEFLDEVRGSVRKLFFVLNKIDQIAPEERTELVAYTARSLADRLGTGSVRLFPLSATQALAAGPGDTPALAESGLLTFQEVLATFLKEEREVVFLVAVLDRAVTALEEARFALELKRRARDGRAVTAPEESTRWTERLDAVEAARRALFENLDIRLGEWETKTLDPALGAFALETVRDLSAAIDRDLTDEPAELRRGCVRVWERARAILQRRRAEWLGAFAGPVADVALGLAETTQDPIRELLAQPERIAAESVGAVAGGTTAAPGGAAEWDWQLPPFAPRSSGESPPSEVWAPVPPRRALPSQLARRLARRDLLRRATREVVEAEAALRSEVVSYLHGARTALDISSGGRLSAERRRIESILRPDSGSGPARESDFAALSRELELLARRARDLRAALLARQPLPTEPEIGAEPATPAVSAAAQEREDPAAEPAAASTATCGVCAAASDAVFRFLCHHQYAIATDPVARRGFLASRGLCPTHTWHLERLSSRRGLCESYSYLLDQTAARLARMAGLRDAAGAPRLRGLLSDSDACAACAEQRRAEQSAVQRIAEALATTDGLRSFAAYRWLCLFHLNMLVAGVEPDAVPGLLRVHAVRLARVSEAMREFALKTDARRRGLWTDEEQRAARQALVMLVGERYLFRTENEE